MAEDAVQNRQCNTTGGTGDRSDAGAPAIGATLALALAAFAPVAFAKAQPRSTIHRRDWTGWYREWPLYPDPLLSQIFVAATLPDQIPDAERWAD